MSCKIFLGRIVIMDGEYVYEVSLYRDGREIKKGKAYIVGNYVYPYRGKLTEDSLDMGLYKHPETGEYVTVTNEKQQDKFHIDNIVEIDNVDKILQDITNNPDEYTSIDDTELSDNSDIYIPVIKETDDFLKKAVKQVLAAKKVNLKNYKHLFPKENAITNYKSALKNDTKMSPVGFSQWGEVLSFGYELRVFDNGGDPRAPFKEEIIVSSED